VFALLIIYLSIWAVLKPPLQSPDEVQHLLRASAVRLEPWISSHRDSLLLDPLVVNPLAFAAPPHIGKLFFHNEHHLVPSDIAFLKTVAWLPPQPSPLTMGTPLASYPPGYYGPVFLLAEGTRALLQPSPYQQTYVYRFWTLILASVLWTMVYVVLGRIPETAPHAAVVLAFLLLNPMLAFVTSAATPDAINNPLATIGILLLYRVLTRSDNGLPAQEPHAAAAQDEDRGQPASTRTALAAAVALAACALTKPSGLLVFAASFLAIGVLWRSGFIAVRNAIRGAIVVAVPAVLTWVAFYAWSPPTFRASPPKAMTVVDYAMTLWARLPEIAVSYWGILGWFDYRLPQAWYNVLFVLLLVNAIVLMRASAPVRRFAIFGGALVIGYVVVMIAGEYYYLPTAGLNFQGRHLLPICIAGAAFMLHDVTWARVALFGYLAIVNVALMHASFIRYFAGDWTTFWLSLP
jgi:hypothetical protein